MAQKKPGAAKEPEAAKEHKLLSMKRNHLYAKFHIEIQAPDGVKAFIEQTRGQIESQVANFEGRQESQCKSAYELYSFALAQFPQMMPPPPGEATQDECDEYEVLCEVKIEELLKFALDMGMDEESLSYSDDPADLWQVIFHETYYTQPVIPATTLTDNE